ncbi:ATP-binding protein [Vibrio tritonius]|uniref:ATP-binding protein n=1 Tax=Vibrio tritonius TaxID=1435069 RepID=A0ABS7YKN0_9VIBR|nr:ATP-binding protein [Vibrio tritonius]MCA2015627.1 ATP-binding protein [Vibrio tritonius]
MGFRVNTITNRQLWDKDSTEDNAFTVIIGNNGCGKTQLLVDTCVYYQEMYSRLLNSDSPHIATAVRDVKYHLADWSLLEDRFRHPLPRKLIAASTSQFEKFPLRWKNKKDILPNGFYAYVGSKPYIPYQSPSTRIASKAIQQLLGNERYEERKLAALTNFLHKFDFGGLLRLRFKVAISSDDFINLQKGEQIQPETALILKEAMEEYEHEEILQFIEYCELIVKEPEFVLTLNNISFKLKHLTKRENAKDYDTIDRHIVSTLLRAGLIQLENLETVRNTYEHSNFIENLDIQNVSLTGLAKRSSGEQCLFLLFLGIISSIEDNALICIDEPEISLHPQWQQRFVNILQEALANYHGCHFIIATHSPLIVSDISNQSCRVYDMTCDRLLDAEPYKQRSSDYQLATIFHNPGRNNEYLITQIIEVLDGFCRPDDTESKTDELISRAKDLLRFEQGSDIGDKVKTLLDILRKTMEAWQLK